MKATVFNGKITYLLIIWRLCYQHSIFRLRPSIRISEILGNLLYSKYSKTMTKMEGILETDFCQHERCVCDRCGQTTHTLHKHMTTYVHNYYEVFKFHSTATRCCMRAYVMCTMCACTTLLIHIEKRGVLTKSGIQRGSELVCCEQYFLESM